MADKPVTEIVNLDAVLDALTDSPTTSDVYEATLPFSARDVAASATQRAINGGGGGGGGASSFTVVRVPISFDTPGLVLTGIPIHTFATGDYVPGNDLGLVTISDTWDGTTPTIHIRAQGGTDYFSNGNYLGFGNSPADNGGEFPASGDDGLFGGFGVFFPGAGTVLEAMVDDGAAGDPGSTKGTGELVLVFIPGT